MAYPFSSVLRLMLLLTLYGSTFSHTASQESSAFSKFGEVEAGDISNFRRDAIAFTIFSTFKPVQSDNIQRNAVKSWTLLEPRPEIILFGDDEGTSELAKEFNVRHIPDIERNEHGLPFVNTLFHQAQQIAETDILLYTNADIMFTNELSAAISLLKEKKQQARKGEPFSEFLMVGKNWRTQMGKPIDFTERDWDTKRVREAREKGHVSLIWAIDYFLFTKGLWGNGVDSIPPFILGVLAFDNWLVHHIHKERKEVVTVDASAVVTALQAYHPPSHASPEQQQMKKYNEGLAVKWHFGNVDRTTHKLVMGSCNIDGTNERKEQGKTVTWTQDASSICIIKR